jgi:hypothetical protein
MIQTPPGTVAIRRQEIEAAPGDYSEIERWLQDRAADYRIAPAVRSRGLRPGRVIARESGPTPYWVVPLQALEEGAENPSASA